MMFKHAHLGRKTILSLALAVLICSAGIGRVQAEDAVAAVESHITEAMLKKIDACRSEAERAWRDARFDQAAQWYQSALQLQPGDAGLSAALTDAHAKLDAQRRALADLPSDGSDREQFFKAVYRKAVDTFDNERYDQALVSFENLWLVAGDYKGRTLDYIERSKAKASEGAAIAVASAAPQDAPAKAVVTASAPVAPVACEVADEVQDLQYAMLDAHSGGDYDIAEVASDQGSVAPGTGGSQIDDVVRIEVTRTVRNAEILISDGKIDEARQALEVALAAWPSHPRANELYNQITITPGASVPAVPVVSATPAAQPAAASDVPAAPVSAYTPPVSVAAGDTRKVVDDLNARGISAYDEGNLRKARDQWRRALEINPENKMALTWMEETSGMYDRLLADEKKIAEAEAFEAKAQELLNAPITIATDRRVSLDEFMNALSFVTPTELEYYIAEGADAMIYANFVDQPLKTVLDTVLNDIGLSWQLDANNVVTIKSNLISKTFNITPGQISKINAMLDSGELQKIIWGQTEAPAKGVNMVVDERQRVMIVTGSEIHIKRIMDFLPALKEVDVAGLEVKIYTISEEDGPRIEALVNSLIRAQSSTPFDNERLLTVTGSTLIVRDTPENIRMIEELLSDNDFINDIRNDKLEIANFSLVPKDIDQVKSDYVKFFTSKVVNMIETFLYAKGGKSQANAEGRRLWFDENSLQLTMVDTPTNIDRVASYINSLPQLGESQKQDVIFLDYAVAEDLASTIERILELTSSGGGSGGSGEEVTLSMRRGDEREFRDTTIRVLRIEDGDEDDRNDDTVEISFNTGQNVNNQNLRELDTVYVDDYEMTAEDVIPSSGSPGEGSARIRIRYVPQEDRDADEEEDDTPAADLVESEGLTLNPFGDLNALIIRYSDPEKYRDALDLVDMLDKPMNQVQIETKFVQVNEARAKKFSSDFDIEGLGSGRSIDWDTSLINTRFAQEVDEFTSAYEPSTQWSGGPIDFLNATTGIDITIGSYPSISYSLSMLEAEGVINTVNGPMVLALNGAEANFRIEQFTSDDSDEDSNGLVTTSSPFEDLPDIDLNTETEGGSTSGGTLVSAVVLRFTPQITSDKSIILEELIAELLDFEGYASTTVTPDLQDIEEFEDVLYTAFVAPQAKTVGGLVQRHKSIETDARISNGGTIVLGGWTSEFTEEYSSGVPVLRNMPYFGKLFFSREQRDTQRATLLVFLTGTLVD